MAVDPLPPSTFKSGSGWVLESDLPLPELEAEINRLDDLFASGAKVITVGVAARGAYAVVPMGTYPFAAVVNLRTGQVQSRVALPANSGATGSDFVSDSIAVVANPGRNTVTPVNVLRGTAGAEVAVGTYPAAVISDGARIYVLNGNLVNFAPAGPGSVTVLDEGLGVIRTVQLTGINPSAGAIIGSRLYVLNSGRFGGNNGSLSVVNLATLAEESHHTGFGEFPSSIAASPGGDLYVGIYGTGIVVWDPRSRTFRVGLGAPITPAGSGSGSGIGDGDPGRLRAVTWAGTTAAVAGFLALLSADVFDWEPAAVRVTAAAGAAAFPSYTNWLGRRAGKPSASRPLLRPSARRASPG